MKNDPNKQLLQLSSYPDLEILIRTGAQQWASGEITLMVNGRGTIELTQRQAGTKASFTGTLPPAKLDALGRSLSTHRFTAPRTTSLPREPGDTPVVLSIHNSGELLFQVEVWNADRDSDSDLGAILRDADQLSYRVSAGKLGAQSSSNHP